MSTKEKKIVSLAAEKLNVLYRDTLDTITKARYLDKLKIIDGKDPYEVNKGEWKKTDIEKWPDLCYPDIVNYLVCSQSVYTLDQLKAYKSLQAYNYFISGFVQDLGHTVINGKSVFLAKIKHSQRMNETPLLPWLIAETDGSVISAHCTCMAGTGEVCSHVGAVLFAVEAAVKIRNTKTVTQEKAYWLLPSSISKVRNCYLMGS